MAYSLVIINSAAQGKVLEKATTIPRIGDSIDTTDFDWSIGGLMKVTKVVLWPSRNLTANYYPGAIDAIIVVA